ncbi:MAG TPA: hypothetical protein VFJ16_30415 [Longimicrobium sp.]|nr:hypothetical protein [Longimicrobium sp.]
MKRSRKHRPTRRITRRGHAHARREGWAERAMLLVGGIVLAGLGVEMLVLVVRDLMSGRMDMRSKGQPRSEAWYMYAREEPVAFYAIQAALALFGAFVLVFACQMVLHFYRERRSKHAAHRRV